MQILVFQISPSNRRLAAKDNAMKCLNCGEMFTLPGNFSDASDCAMCTATCPACGQNHDHDLHTGRLSLPMTFKEKVLWYGGIIVAIALLVIAGSALGLK